MKFSFKNTAVTIFASMSLLAQVPIENMKVFDRVVWGSQGTRYYLPFNPESPVVIDRLGGQVRSKLMAPDGIGNGWSVRGDVIYFLQAKEESDSEVIQLLKMDLDQAKPTWESLGRIDTSEGFPTFIIPLDKDNQFLAFNWFTGFTHEKSASFAARFIRNPEKGILKLDSLVEMPFDSLATIAKRVVVEAPVEPALAGGTAKEIPAKPAPEIAACEAVKEALNPTLWSPVITRDHVLLAATRPGVVWLFQLKDGACLKTLNLGGLAAKELDHLPFLNHFILGMQPTPNGEVIIATRHPDVLKAALALKSGAGTSTEAIGNAKADFRTFNHDDGRIVWWEVLPDTLSCQKTESLNVKCLRVLDYAKVSRLKFLVDNLGQVITNYSSEWSDFNAYLQAQQPQAGKPAKNADSDNPTRSGGKTEPKKARPEPGEK